MPMSPGGRFGWEEDRRHSKRSYFGGTRLADSCSGYPLIPYSGASDACSRRCVNPAAKKNCILSAPAARLAPIALICCPREFRAAPLAQHGRGIRAVVLIVFSNVNTLINAVSCFPRRHRGIVILPSSSDDGGVRSDDSDEEAAMAKDEPPRFSNVRHRSRGVNDDDDDDDDDDPVA